MSETVVVAQREPEDYYTSPSWTVRRLLEAWQPPKDGVVVEAGAGNGAVIKAVGSLISRKRWRAIELRIEETAALSALADQVVIGNFLHQGEIDPLVKLVMGNWPFSRAWEFFIRARYLYPAAAICVQLRLAFIASQERAEQMRKCPPDLYVLPDRPQYKGDGNSDNSDYAWFNWPPVGERSAGRLVVLNTTPLDERKLDRGHEVMIEPRQKELF